ncbi:hypothetical protein SARC_05670 [Sphaeroforma arctica JP610]|uniref:RNA polymerase III Rpc82 C -terminal domain-containing protein n=1 Tax=Sphaeroforma arctica JP610 TaxID=667725 RepID=A0A0L0G1F2_9EUKA|nr:hypothetical protein SARC_05670 [Sphaeroforma arctica JP610]KNC82033.1 hypothetical protein SARC_05670 [Sphaeroforma arctica JP610]|eukprot:XP_014155935.1 hypothetical protein SARC_05670 [Sphaeroforma arctica JP610]
MLTDSCAIHMCVATCTDLNTLSSLPKAVDDLEEGAENKRSKTTHDGISGSLTVSSFGLVEEGEDVVLWRLNEKHFHMHMRNTAILDLITKQTGDASAQACVKSLLEMSVLNEQSVNEHTGVVTTQAVGAYQVYKYMVTRNMLPEMGEAKLNAKNTVQIFEALVVLTDGAIETADAATTGAGQFVIMRDLGIARVCEYIAILTVCSLLIILICCVPFTYVVFLVNCPHPQIVRDLGSAFVSEHGALHTILLDDPETWDDEEEVLNAKEKDVIAKLQTSLNRITASILLIDQSLLVMDGFE